MTMKTRAWAICIGLFLLGFALGAYLFADTQRRSLLAVADCDHCLEPNEVAGLAASVLIQTAPSFVPSKVLETERTLVIDHPMPQDEHHVVLFPKRDIKNIGTLQESDREYLVDLFATVGRIVEERNLRNYRLWTNGPGAQMVTYLHFHLAGH